jgi:hypothetical protein
MSFTALWLATGCLPEGEAGIGEVLMSGRGLSDLRLTGGRAGTPEGMLYSRRAAVTNVRRQRDDEGHYINRYDLPYDLMFLPSAGEPRLLIDNYEAPAYWDAAGRLYARRDITYTYLGGAEGIRATADLWRFQLGEPAGTSLGRVEKLGLSPGGTRVLYESEKNQWLLRDMEDRELRFQTGDSEPRFHGEDLFFVRDGTLWRIHDLSVGPVAILWGEKIGFDPRGIGGGRMLLSAWVKSQSKAVIFRSGSQEPPEVIELPAKSAGPVLSPDGKRLAWVQRLAPDRGRLRVIDLDTHQETSGELPLSPPRVIPPRPGPGPPPDGPEPGEPITMEDFAELEFRPGTSELWCFFVRQLSILRGQDDVATFAHDLSDGSDFVLAPPTFADEPFFKRERQTGFSSVLYVDPRSRQSRFSRDGRFWTTHRGDEGHLADADHPESKETVLLFSKDTFDERVLYEYIPGRRAAYRFRVTFDKHDLHVVDLEQRKVRTVARDIASAILGPTRAVVRLRTLTANEGPGDLSLVDLETGAETVLARNVADFAVAPACADCDPTGPGAQLVYVVHGRLPWKYDGLWTAVLP